MSFGRNFGDHFNSDTDPSASGEPSFSSDFNKRFDQLEEDFNKRRNMFYERANQWPYVSSFRGIPSQFTHSTRNKDDTSSGIPIKVVHQRDSADNHDSQPSSLGSTESHHSVDHGDNGHHENPSGGLDRSSSTSSHGSSHGRRDTQEATHKPREHYIPIQVEPRGEAASYVSDIRRQTPVSRSGSNSSQLSGGRTPSPATKFEARQPNSPIQPDGSKSSPVSNAKLIPIQRENNGIGNSPPRDIPKVRQSTPGLGQSTRKRPQPSNREPATGPFVTRIPVTDESSNHPPSSPPQREPVIKKDPLDIINEIIEEVRKWKEQVDNFAGSLQDKEYKYLDEMLTRCLLKLDNVETNGREDVRQTRKATIISIEDCLSFLETKAKANSSIELDQANKSNEAKQESDENNSSEMEVENDRIASANEDMESDTIDQNSTEEKDSSGHQPNDNNEGLQQTNTPQDDEVD